MRIESGAGVFDVRIDGASPRPGGLDLRGTVDEWDCKTIVDADEMARVFLMCIRPGTLNVLIKGLLQLARNRVGARRAKMGAR